MYKIIAKRYLQSRKTLLISCLIAIIIVSVLLISLLTMVLSIQKSYQQMIIDEVGLDFHGQIGDISEKEILKLLEDDRIYGGAYTLNPGVAVSSAALQDLPYSVDLCYVSSHSRSVLYNIHELIDGYMPKTSKEIVTSVTILDALGLPHQVGIEIPISYIEIVNEIEVETVEIFTLSGFFDSTNQTFNIAEFIFVSQEYMHKNFPSAYGQVAFYFMQNGNFEKQGVELLPHIHKVDPYAYFSVNRAYKTGSFENLDPLTLLAGGFLVFFVLFTGYIVINNLFTIFMHYDVALYGQLKCLGSSTKQIKRILRIQLMYLIVLGLPIGCVLGYISCNYLLPIVARQFNGIHIQTHPYVYILTALFVFFCLWVSISNPIRFCKTISPAHLLSGSTTTKVAQYRNRKKQEISIYYMGKLACFSQKNRLIKIVISLSVVPVILLGVTTFSKSMDPDTYIQKNMATDFVVAKNRYFIIDSLDESIPYLDASFIDNIKPGLYVREGGFVYFKKGATRYYDNETLMYDDITSTNYSIDTSNTFTAIHDNLNFELSLYGMDPFLVSSYEILDGEIDLEKFKSGNYIIDIHTYQNGNQDDTLFPPIPLEIGSSVDVYYNETYINTYTVMASVMYRTAIELRESQYPYLREFILPPSEFLQIQQESQINPNNYILNYAFNVPEEYIEQTEIFLQEIISNNPSINYESASVLRAQIKEFSFMIQLVGGFFAIMVGIIGLVNLGSIIIVSIYSRKDQFINLRKIGMTKGQLETMVVYESLLYSAVTSVIFILLGILIIGALNKIIVVLDFISFQISIFPSAVVFICYIGLSILFSKLALQKLFKLPQNTKLL